VPLRPDISKKQQKQIKHRIPYRNPVFLRLLRFPAYPLYDLALPFDGIKEEPDLTLHQIRFYF